MVLCLQAPLDVKWLKYRKKQKKAVVAVEWSKVEKIEPDKTKSYITKDEIS